MGCSKLTKLLPTFQNLDQLYTPLGQVIVLLESTKAQLSYPFIINEFTLKDSIDLVNWIQDSSTSLFKNGYKYVLFDVELLFTNIIINKAIGIIFTRIYNDPGLELRCDRDCQ